jgi:hypothetical protein
LLSLICRVLIFILAFLFAWDCSAEAIKPTNKKAYAGNRTQQTCTICHSDLTSVLPKAHPAVTGRDITACLSCHSSENLGKAQPNIFSTRLHRAHVGSKLGLTCLTCHVWIQNKSFSLRGRKGSWGAPSKDDMELIKTIFSSWTEGPYMDSLHAKANLSCASCHGNTLPKPDDSVEKSRCLECHGPEDDLVKKTEPKDFQDRNPHKSHLGEINCTVCHHSHSKSMVLCLDCHRKFNMKIQGSPLE